MNTNNRLKRDVFMQKTSVTSDNLSTKSWAELDQFSMGDLFKYTVSVSMGSFLLYTISAG